MDTYVSKSSPGILRCKIENARAGFFKCNDQWSQEPSSSQKLLQVGNKQILVLEQGITRSQVDEFNRNKSSNVNNSQLYWCTCHGWLSSADDTIISRKAYIKLAYMDHNFLWEPMPTIGLIGKSAEIRCLPPDGDPRPLVFWLKNGIPVDKTSRRVLVSNEGSLLINEVRLADQANYTCIAENLVGKMSSDSAVLTVFENRGWSAWGNWTNCESLSSGNCGEGEQKRTRQCLNPPTINNALGCDGYSKQTLACYVPCELAKPHLIVEPLVPNLYSWSVWSTWYVLKTNWPKAII